MNNPKVSTVLPTYNRCKFIEQSILSVLNQTFQDLEIIVVDDGSEDNTESVVKSIKDNRIKYIKNEENTGVTKSLNRGIREASGEYIARIDDQDEWIDKRKLEKQVDFLDSDKDNVLIGTGAVVSNVSGSEVFRYLKPVKDQDIRSNMLLKNCFIHPSVVFSKKAFLKVGGYNNKIKVGQDYDLWLRLGKVGKMANLPDYSINYVSDDQSVSNKRKVEQIKQNFSLIKRHKEDYPNYGIALVRNLSRLIIYGYLDFSFIKKITSKFNS